MGLNADQHVKIFIEGGILDQILESVSAFKKDGTFTPFIRVQIKPKPKEVAKLTDGKKPCHKEDKLANGDEKPYGQQTHLLIKIIGFQGCCEGHQ